MYFVLYNRQIFLTCTLISVSQLGYDLGFCWLLSVAPLSLQSQSFYAVYLGATTLSIRILSIRTLSITTLSITTLSITTLSIRTLSITTLSIRTLSITALNIMTLSIMTYSKLTLSIMTFCKMILSTMVKCCLTEWNKLAFMLSIVMLNVFMLGVVAP